MTPLF
jgi:hypothetical protein